MTVPRYRAREARGAADHAAVLRLRALAFHGDPARDDAEAGDARCTHFVVEPAMGGAPLCAFRTMLLSDGAEVETSFAAQAYDLTRLSEFKAPMIELGRFCLHPALRDPDILRLAWGMLARQVDRNGVALLFGCASFAGTDPASHAAALSRLSGHAAPARWAPGRRAPEAVALPPVDAVDPRAGLKAMPPLLRSYLGMGAWVSDHAVIDRAMGTVHVFCGVETARIPPRRKRALRALAASG